ncbi:AAA family ATPase [Diaphorobacter limosus]|uniref:AAA family ATPase n=1 Tax=Diaphorobacter limosus TaxID=3036128 RepID=A0ABZ0J0Z0_9BURK|nr:AAA family ATPase [Diaphorobacter sp. Y-1]WOO31202.1 AAA family ATPase [Diaphorobacter sp. Y-1]
MSSGTFGITREKKIISSGARKVFTPHAPVDDISHFFGREEEASRFVSVINTDGLHVLVYGDRGVGKTSLAITTCRVLLQGIMKGGKYIEKRCDSSDTFESIALKVLQALEINHQNRETTQTTNEGGKASVKIPIVGAEVDSHRQSAVKILHQVNLSSPSWVAEQIQSKAGIFLIDEIDAVADKEDRKKLAELVKLLSDNKSQLKIVLVGIASTGADLTAGHPSIQRCLKEVHLKRMNDDDVRKIIHNGFKKIGQIPTEDVVKTITDISAGLPHFTHLICLKCAEASVISGNKHVGTDVLKAALNESVKDSENALKDSYTNCLHNFNKPHEYKIIVQGAAHCKGVEFRASDIQQQIKVFVKFDVDQKVVSRRLIAIAARADSIMEKCGRGYYRFVDPRMPSFVKMLHGADAQSAV